MNKTIDITSIAGEVEAALNSAPGRPDAAQVEVVLERALRLKGLSLEDAATLLMVDDPEGIGFIARAAGRVKEAVFGPRVVLFAPLYLANMCSNDCVYCGFRRSNPLARRKALSPDEAAGQARLLSSRGFKRLLLVAGEHPRYSGLDYLVESAERIYAETDIRILHVNCAPLTVEGFRTLKAAGFGVYQCFQETYHPGAYAAMHPSGRKKDYLFRLSAMDRALEAGFGDVGLGALLGLHDYRYDVLSVITHSRHLEARFGAAAHTISVPRLRPAEGAVLTHAPCEISDLAFRKIVAVYRLSVPYAGVVVTTREPAALRDAVMEAGASQLSAGSSTEPGGYGDHRGSTAQFEVSDLRGLPEMVKAAAARGFLPSLCTSCYRSGRQGADFRAAAEAGGMKDLCTANAVLSLKEYALDITDGELKKVCEEAIRRFTAAVPGPLRRGLAERLERTEKGERDLHY